VYLLPSAATECLVRPRADDLRGKLDRAIFALLIRCGLRRAELVRLGTGDFQIREDHWVIADLIGKGKHTRRSSVGETAVLGCKQRIRQAVNDNRSGGQPTIVNPNQASYTDVS